MFTSKVILTNNNKEIEIFRDETSSNFGEVNIAIDEVLNNLAELIRVHVEMKIDDEFKNTEEKINAELNKLYASISDAPDFLELFHGPLDQLLKDIMAASGACYNKVYVESGKTTDAFGNISTLIDENNLQLLISKIHLKIILKDLLIIFQQN